MISLICYMIPVALLPVYLNYLSTVRIILFTVLLICESGLPIWKTRSTETMKTHERNDRDLEESRLHLTHCKFRTSVLA